MTYYDYLIIISSSISILMAVSLLMRPPVYRNIVFSLFLIFLSYLNIFLYLEFIHSSWNLPVFSFLKMPFKMMLGPLIYLYIQSLIQDKVKFEKKDWLHFLVIALYMLILLLLLYINRPAYDLLKHNRGIYELTGMFFFDSVVIISILYLAVYIFLSIKNIAGRIKSNNPTHSRIMIFVIILIICMFTTMTAVAAIIARSELLFRTTGILISIIIISLFFISQRNPYLLMHGMVSINRKAKSKSHLSKVDLQQLGRQLNIIMEKEKFYCDEDLTLKRLSDALEVTPHQLSEFLNEHHKKNFKNFINTYRINEAKRLLLEEPNRNALSIAYAAGFNSYSTFRSFFKKEERMSPADFRKLNLKTN